MQRSSLRAAAVGVALLMGMAGSALADAKDYEFQLLDKEVKQGAAVISVKLVHKPSGRAIADAVIFAKRIDMGPEAMEGMTAPIEADLVHRTGRLPLQDRPRHGRRMGLVARRQGAGRDRDGREQTHRQGHPMSPLTKGLVSVAAIMAAAGAGLWAGQTGMLKLPMTPAVAMTEEHPEATGPVIYYRDPSGKPFYSLTPRNTDGGRSLCGRPRQRGRVLRSEAEDGTGSAGRRRTLRRQEDQVLPQPDGFAGHLADAEEGLDGDGLHPRLRGRGQRRRFGQGIAGQDPAHRRGNRGGRPPSHHPHHPGAGRGCDRRAPRRGGGAEASTAMSSRWAMSPPARTSKRATCWRRCSARRSSTRPPACSSSRIPVGRAAMNRPLPRGLKGPGGVVGATPPPAKPRRDAGVHRPGQARTASAGHVHTPRAHRR